MIPVTKMSESFPEVEPRLLLLQKIGKAGFRFPIYSDPGINKLASSIDQNCWKHVNIYFVIVFVLIMFILIVLRLERGAGNSETNGTSAYTEEFGAKMPSSQKR